MTNKNAFIIALIVLLILVIAAASTRINALQAQLDETLTSWVYDPCSPADNPESFTDC